MILAGLDTTPTTQPDAVERFVEDHALTLGVVVMIVVVALGIGLTLAAMHRHERQRAMAPTAKKHGLGFSAGDLFSTTEVAFPLFRAGDGGRVENVMYRDGANGLPVRVFDYSFYVERQDENGRVTKSWRHFTCAMARHNGLWPTIRVARERRIDRLAQKIGLADIELESEEFNRRFIVQCDDRKFATDLLGPEMMDLLLTTDGMLDFETKGRWLLVTTSRVRAQHMPALLNVADEFCRRIPGVVRDLYPSAPHDEELVPEEGMAAGALDGRAIHIPGVDAGGRPDFDLDGDEIPTSGAGTGSGVEYDLDGNPTKPVDEDPWT